MAFLSVAGSQEPGIIGRLLTMLRPKRTVVQGHIQTAYDGLPRLPRMHSLDSDAHCAVLFAGAQGEGVCRAANVLRDHGFSVKSCRTLSDVKSEGVWHGDHWSTSSISHLLVDVDGLGGICAIFSELRRIRDSIPGLAVILISSDFSVDDFSIERLAICDASIRANFTFASLEFAMLESSFVNNGIWQQRLEDLKLSPLHAVNGQTNLIAMRA